MSRFPGWNDKTMAAADRSRLSERLDRQPKPSKYRAQAVVVDGIRFDSKAEAQHYGRLKLARDAGALTFERQVPFIFEVTYTGANGRTAKRKMKYIADFVVTFTDGRTELYSGGSLVEVQDVKGVRTKEYKMKKKLMLDVYGIEIREIKK